MESRRGSERPESRWNHLPVVAGFAALFLAIAAGAAGRAGSGVSRETRTLSNGNLSLTVTLEETATGARFVIDSLEDPETGIDLDLSRSPIWQLRLAGRSTPPPGTPWPAEGTLSAGSVTVPTGHASWGASGPGELVLRWTGLEAPEGQTLDVEVSIRLRESDGKTEWRIRASLSGGPLMIVSAAFPLLDLPGIGPDPSDDILFHPAQGGSIVRNPVGCGASPQEFDSTDDPETILLYPGNVASQFMSLSDGDAGLYMAAEDREGSAKSLVYGVTDGRLRLWFRNDNTTAYDPDRAAMAEALRTLDLDALGYPVVVGFFHGDWMDAADLYREWAIRAGAPFLAQGFLASRNDIGRLVKEAVLLVRYSFGFFDSTPVVPERDEARLGAVIDFFLENEPGMRLAVGFIGVVAGREDADVVRESWYGSHGRPELDGDLKPGVPEVIDWLWRNHGVPAGHNRDTGNWFLAEGSTEARLYQEEDALHRAIVRRWDGTPARKHWDELQRHICSGSPWQMARREAIRRATVLDSRGSDSSGPGFQFLIPSGQGTVPKLCYAPLLADNPATDHWHPPGGGSWWNERFAEYAARLRSLYPDDAPFYTLIPEREHERLIGVPGVGILGGKGRVYPFSDDAVVQAGGGALPCSQPVPLSMYLYHEYVLQGRQGAYYSDFVRLFGEGYGAGGRLVPHPTYYDAVGVLTGRIPTLLLRSDRLGAGEDSSVDGPFFEQLSPEVQDQRRFLRLLIETRHRNLPYLGWGRMLRLPTTETDMIQMEAFRDGSIRTYPVKAVIATAFQARDGSIRIFVANHTREARTYVLSFDPQRYGIDPGSCRRLDRLGPDGSVTPMGRVCGGGIATIPSTSIAPLSVHVLSLSPETPEPRQPRGREHPRPGRRP